MYPLIMLFFRIATFKLGPQDVPGSSTLLRLLIPIYVLVNYTILMLNGASSAGLQIAMDFVMLAAFSWPLLYFAGKTARFPQTFGALLGTDIVISFFALPPIASLNAQPTDAAYLAMLALMIWHWLVSGHIFRHALDRPLFFGLGLALLYIMLSSQVMAALFPEMANLNQ